MAHTRTRRLFKRKLHLHSYIYMDKTSPGRTKRFFLVIAAPLCCQAFLALRLVYAYVLSDPNPSLHSFPATLTSLVPRHTLLALSQLLQTSLVPSHTDFTCSQAGLADTYVRTRYARTHARSARVRQCSRHHDSWGSLRLAPITKIGFSLLGAHRHRLVRKL